MGTVSVPVIIPPVSLYQATRGVLRHLHRDTYYPFGPGAGHLQFSTPFVCNVNIL